MATLTRVVTSTDQPADTLGITLEAEKLPEPQQEPSVVVNKLVMLRLELIVDTYLDWSDSDPLSRRLADWTFDVLDIDPSDENFRTELEGQVDILANEILISPLDKAPLKIPMLVGRSVLDQWLWEEILRTLPNLAARVSSDPTIEVKVHNFGLEMILWMNDLPFNKKREPTLDLTNTIHGPVVALLPANTKPYLNPSLCSNANSPESQLIKGIFYTELVNNALQTNRMQVLRSMMEAGTEALRELWQKTRETILLESEKSRIGAELHFQKIQASLEKIDQVRQLEVSVLKDEVTYYRGELSEARDRIQAVERKNILNEDQIRMLHDRFAQQLASSSQQQRKGRRRRR